VLFTLWLSWHAFQLLIYGGTAEHLGQAHYPKELFLLDLGECCSLLFLLLSLWIP
jgi:hypothetical protein